MIARLAATSCSLVGDTPATAAESSVFVREALSVVRDLLRPKVARYWLDLLVTMGMAYAALALCLASTAPDLVRAAAFPVAALAIYRGAIFTHEIAHRQPGSFQAFMVVWNLVCGIPFLMPSFLYGDHKGHHTNASYGTWSDPEYILRSGRRRLKIVLFLLLPVVYPLLAVVRFLLLTPVACISRRADRVIWRSASSLYIMNEFYRREYAATASSPSRWVQEIAACGWAWLVVLLAARGRLPWATLAIVYGVSLLWIGLNQARTLAAHSYMSGTRQPISYLHQLLDTNTFAGGWILPDLWAPLGLRYHALHHLVPSMPYHAMSEAHRRLMSHFPPASPYHRTLKPGLWQVLWTTVRESGSVLPREDGVPADTTASRPASRQ